MDVKLKKERFIVNADEIKKFYDFNIYENQAREVCEVPITEKIRKIYLCSVTLTKIENYARLVCYTDKKRYYRNLGNIFYLSNDERIARKKANKLLGFLFCKMVSYL